MKSQVSKHWEGKGYNTPLKQVKASTKLRDVPGELSNSIERGVDRIGNRISKGIKEIGDMPLGDAVAGVAGTIAGPLVGNRVTKAVKGYLNGPTKKSPKVHYGLRKEYKDLNP